MPLKLDPRLPLVWRSPSSLQFGVDAPPVVLDEVSSAQERMIAALVAGVSRPGLSMIGRAAGADESEVASLLETVAPALVTHREHERQWTVAVNGGGATVDLVVDTLRASGVTIDTNPIGAEPVDAARPDFAVIIAHYVIEPELHGLWLRRDVPHLAIVFGDTRVRIGPVVEPGSGPCLHCLERQRTDADPAWPAIASQLWGRRSPAESTLVSSEVAALASRLVMTRLLDGPRPGSASLHLDAATGVISQHERSPHPECGCMHLGGDQFGGD